MDPGSKSKAKASNNNRRLSATSKGKTGAKTTSKKINTQGTPSTQAGFTANK